MRSEREGASAHSSSGLTSGALEETGVSTAAGESAEISTLEELEAGELEAGEPEEEAGLVKSFPLTKTGRERRNKSQTRVSD